MKTFGLTLAAVASLTTTTAALAGPQDEMIVYTHRKPQPLVTGSSFRNIVLIGAVGGFIGDRIEGHLLAKDYEIQDPQDEIAASVANEIAMRRGAPVGDGPLDVRGLSRSAIARSQPPGRYLVDVESTKREFMWSLIRGQWTRYTVGYNANLAVLDIPNGEYVIRDRCAWSTPKADRMSRRLLLDDRAANLKAQFQVGAEACATQFKASTQELWLADRQHVAYESSAYRTAPPASVAMAPLPPEVRAEPAYYGPPPSAYAPRGYDAAPPVIVEQAYDRSYESQRPANVEYRYARPAAPPPRPATYAPHGRDAARPVIVEYSYARPYEAPPSRRPVAGAVDANGYLIWPGK